MSTKVTPAHHSSDEADKPSWHFYEEVLEEGVVYLELEGVSVELCTREAGAPFAAHFDVHMARPERYPHRVTSSGMEVLCPVGRLSIDREYALTSFMSIICSEFVKFFLTPAPLDIPLRT